MRKRNKVKQLQRTSAHRNAMLKNQVLSLLFHEQIKTTTAKAKVTAQIAEKLISRAKKNLVEGVTPEAKQHNVKIAAKTLPEKEVLAKLFNDIAPRNVTRNGGYTRIIKLGKRNSDASEMALLQLVEKRELVEILDDRKTQRAIYKEKKKK